MRLRFFIFFCAHKRKRNKRKSAGCTFLATLARFSAKQKELAFSMLKQLFVFNAPKRTSASRQKHEAGGTNATLLRSLLWMSQKLSPCFRGSTRRGRGLETINLSLLNFISNSRSFFRKFTVTA